MESAAPAVQAAPEAPAGDGPVCPGCGQTLPKTAKICVACGINLATGRAILTTSDENIDEIYSTVESALWWVSWVVPTGIFPIASEALGVRRPYVTWAITALTIFITIGVWITEAKNPGNSPRVQTTKQLELWGGRAIPDAEDIEAAYYFSGYGDPEAYEEKLDELRRRPSSKSGITPRTSWPAKCFGCCRPRTGLSGSTSPRSWSPMHSCTAGRCT